MLICDTAALDTLTDHYFADGCAEGIKYGLLADKDLFDAFARGVNRRDMDDIVCRCVEIKRDFVQGDERDMGKRQMLNLGHTVGHAIEKLSGYSISHGHAVAMGMVVMCRAAYSLGYSQENCTPPLLQALDACHLPSACPYDAASLAKAALSDKKRRGDSLTLILPQRMGECCRETIPMKDLEGFIAAGLGER